MTERSILCSENFLEKLTVCSLVKKYSTFTFFRRFITVITTARYYSEYYSWDVIYHFNFNKI
jgi:hypothetical protein